MSISITAKQIGLLHHTLGVTPERRTPYRNHFVAGPGHDDQPDIEVLEALGLMARSRTPGFCDPSDVVFCCTDAGRSYALDHLPHPPKRTKYDEYLAYDGGYSNFAEFLGIEVPRRDYGRDLNGRSTVRLWTSRARGEWKPTVKEAKASYKQALRASRA